MCEKDIKINVIGKEIIKKQITTQSKQRRKTIPKKIKQMVWNRYIGEEKGVGLCQCCLTTQIDKMFFHCGHIISVKNGGSTYVNNLRPICALCNHSMGSQNMDDFQRQYFENCDNDKLKIEKQKKEIIDLTEQYIEMDVSND